MTAREISDWVFVSNHRPGTVPGYFMVVVINNNNFLGGLCAHEWGSCINLGLTTPRKNTLFQVKSVWSGISKAKKGVEA